LQLANQIDTPEIFHGFMARCVTYAQLNEKEKAKKELEKLLTIYPHFITHGKELLTRFLGPEGIADKLWQGILIASKSN